eukprot:3808549-Rhodomonas_salina.2
MQHSARGCSRKDFHAAEADDMCSASDLRVVAFPGMYVVRADSLQRFSGAAMCVHVTVRTTAHADNTRDRSKVRSIGFRSGGLGLAVGGRRESEVVCVHTTMVIARCAGAGRADWKLGSAASCATLESCFVFWYRTPAPLSTARSLAHSPELCTAVSTALRRSS